MALTSCPATNEFLSFLGAVVLAVYLLQVIRYGLRILASALFTPSPKKVYVELEEDEKLDVLVGKKKIDPNIIGRPGPTVPLFDPSTLDLLGELPVHTEADVLEMVRKARTAQKEWKKSSFCKRKLLMRTFLRYFIENKDNCARVAVRDSGKTMLDAIIGEILVTCEKLTWLAESGEKYLQREYRDTGKMMMMKRAYVEYTPVGVIGAIVPWNYPFHNVFNPVSAALFSGNAIIIKVSEYASWSIRYYKRIIDACLEAVGAPKDLVQFVVGYAAAGSALVTSGVDKIIFVGSPLVGSIVAKTAADKLTPVVLELGGKDPFVVCDDVDVTSIVQTAVRGVWQNMGQNCAGPERFFVYEKLYDKFCSEVTSVVSKLKVGASLGDPAVDCGSICMGPRQMQLYQKLVDDAVSKGAKILAGGFIPTENDPLSKGCFYPPTILADIPENALIAQEEIFGPIMAIFKVKNNDDKEALRLANNCDFALSSCFFSSNELRAYLNGSQLEAGMNSINDLEGCTYMNQSLPFGGYKKSGYDRFAGPEGLRGLCNIRSVCIDLVTPLAIFLYFFDLNPNTTPKFFLAIINVICKIFSFFAIRNAIPGPMQYPSSGVGPDFAKGLIDMFYSPSITGKISGLISVIKFSGGKPGAFSNKKKND